MNKTATTIARAFLDRRHKTIGNASTDGETLRYRGNAIARHTPTGWEISLAGWPTPTTRRYLNALPRVWVHQSGGDQFLNGVPWDGCWTDPDTITADHLDP
jgi:hypothetical protein